MGRDSASTAGSNEVLNSGYQPKPVRVLGSQISTLLVFYLRYLNHPCKLRLWYFLFRVLRWPKLLVRYAKSSWLVLDQRDLPQRMILWKGYYEPEVWEVLAAHLSENEIFWDIGAHIGSVTVRAALDSRIQSVHSFEPSPIILPSLRTNIEFNKLNQVKIYPFGLSEKSGTFPLYFGPVTNRGMTSLNKTSGGSNAASTLVV